MGLVERMNSIHTIDDPRDFWAYLEALVSLNHLVIDRPQGSTHPRYPGQVYPVDYGYLEGTTSSDGSGIDVWRGSLEKPTLDAVLLTADMKKRDAEIKLLLGCTPQDKQQILGFTNAELMRGWLVERNPGLELMRGRRSVRRFAPVPVPQDVVERILEAATWAPSAHHRQPWRMAVLVSQSSKILLGETMGDAFFADLLADGITAGEAQQRVRRSRQRLQEAPVGIILCLDSSTGDIYPDPERQHIEHLMGVQGVAMAGQNLLLAAHSAGLGGVWLCSPLFAQHAVRAALNLPDTWQPLGLILLGYPAPTPEPRPRTPIDEITRFY